MQYRKMILVWLFVQIIAWVPAHSQTVKKYFVYLKDKTNSPYSIDKPDEFLSKRAIERRKKQNITVSSRDFPVNPTYITQIKNTGATVWYSSRWMNGVLIETDATTLATVQGLSFVKSTTVLNNGRQLEPKVEEGKKSRRQRRKDKRKARRDLKKKQNSQTTTPNKSDEILRTTQEILIESKEDYGNSYRQDSIVGVDIMHSSGYRGTGVWIAVFDSGFQNVDKLSYFKHLFDNSNIAGTYDFVTNQPNVYNTGSHGTKVLSTVASYERGVIIGSAPEATYWLFRTEDVSSEYRIEEVYWLIAAERADSTGVDIINSSLGYNTFDDASMNYTYNDLDGNTTLITKAADFAAATGMLVVNSAGNEGNSSWRYVGAPADGDSVLAVGSVNFDGAYSSFSSKGNTADGRIKPNITAMGSFVSLGGPFGPTSGSGTSFSAPIVSGLAAGFWQANPNLTNMQVIDFLQRSASQASKPDSLLGYGIPNFRDAMELAKNPTSLESVTESGFSFYPNPIDNSQYLQIVFNQSYRGKDLKMTLHDAQGKLVGTQYLKSAPKEYRWEKLQYLKSGVYLLRISNSEQSQAVKVVKR
ncbi:hypothetical protein BKI52_07545 [marine bacterium AO1-C]|nr:hypothetical protein BKI52_07545 [marine bacterium AO1-C]